MAWPALLSNPAVIGGLVAAGGSILGGVFNANSQSDTNRTNKEIADNNTEFQSRMSNTAHQREVADLRAAGLNPNLSTHGTGAGTPSGTTSEMRAPSIQMPDLLAMGLSIKDMENKQKQLAQTDTSLQQSQQRVNNETLATTASVAKSTSDTDLNKVRKMLYQQQTGLNKKQGTQMDAETELIQAKKIMLGKGMPRALLEGEASGVLSNIMEWIKKKATQQPRLQDAN